MNPVFYKCGKCGTLVEVLKDGSELNCCGELMAQVIPNSVDAALEKHVPVIEFSNDGVTVKIGSEPHPMEEVHYIEWVEIFYDSRRERKYLSPGEKPEASFRVAAKEVTAFCYCNLHGLWTAKK